MVALLAAGAAMAVRDALAVFLVVAEAKGRAWLAGILDAASDLASIAVTVVGAGAVLTHGIVASLPVLAVMCTVSLFGTTLWTKLGTRMRTAA